jgi:hypothetical protein
MNLGIYVNSLGDLEQMKYISECINSGLTNRDLVDASIFYNDVAYNPFELKCGTFNSTDLWNFHGILVSPSLSCIHSASNIVNNINLYYYYGWEKDISVLEIISVLQNPHISIICNSEKDSQELYRLTNKRFNLVCENYNDLLTILKRCNNGCSKNCKNVCRAK